MKCCKFPVLNSHCFVFNHFRVLTASKTKAQNFSFSPVCKYSFIYIRELKSLKSLGDFHVAPPPFSISLASLSKVSPRCDIVTVASLSNISVQTGSTKHCCLSLNQMWIQTFTHTNTVLLLLSAPK